MTLSIVFQIVSNVHYNYRIVYTPIPYNPDIYNLGFGTVNINDQIDDKTEPTINNLAKVIKTVGLTIYEFTNAHPGKSVYFQAILFENNQAYTAFILIKLN